MTSSRLLAQPTRQREDVGVLPLLGLGVRKLAEVVAVSPVVS